MGSFLKRSSIINKCWMSEDAKVKELKRLELDINNVVSKMNIY